LKVELESLLSTLVNEIQGAVRFYDNTSPEEDNITKVLIYGDGAYLKNIDKYLDKNLPDVKVAYANPRIDMVPIPQFISHEKIFSHLVVTGLALRGLGKYIKFEDVNFIPQEIQSGYVNEQVKKRVGNIAKIIFINVIAICGFLLGGLFLLNHESTQIQASINSKVSILKGRSIQSKSEEIKKFNKSLSSISSIISSEFDWINIFDKILSVTPKEVKLNNVSINVDSAGGSKSAPAWTINLYGKTNSRQTVIDYSNSLISTGIFNDVLVPVSAFSTSDEVVFQINMKLDFHTLLADADKFKEKETESSSELELRPFTPAK
ncbi:MAG: pilus assembly protein PilM, partial [Clostridiaceae bacterium]|nr:pilus assembly protein PilM [Clostridiaceae bacterium]